MEKLLTLNENDKYSGFWECILKYKLDDIGIMSECNNPKAFDSITCIYKFLNKSNEFCLKYFLNRVCTSCSYSLKIEEFYNSYIPITLDKLNSYNNINDIIYSLFNIDNCTCPVCGLSLSEIRISLNDRNKLSTFTTVVTKVEYPKFLILHFDLENNNLSSVNYDILKKYQIKILDILSYNIILNNISYELRALINMYSDDHYTASIINGKLNNLYVKKNKNYFNDAFHNNSKIFEEDFSLEDLKIFMKKNVIISAIYSS